MSLKTVLISPLVHRLAHVSGLSTLRAKSQSVHRILTLHEVDDQYYPAKVFKSQLIYLSRHFKIVPLDSLVRRVTNGGAPASNEIALTFDDGLRNNCTIVYPILRSLGLPATFFVCPTLMERGQWQWTHEAAERLSAMPEAGRVRLARELRAPEESAEAFKEWMKRLPKPKRLRVEEKIRSETSDFQPTEKQRIRLDPMSWEELLSLDPGLITIGSHTLTHPILPTLDPEDALFEIRESRRILQERLGRSVEYFCYPDGAYNEPVVASVRKHYRAAVITNPAGFVRRGDDPYLLQRVPALPELAHFTWLLHRPTS